MSGPMDTRLSYFYDRAKVLADGNEALERLMNLSVTRVYMRETDDENGELLYWLNSAEIYHIRDWLRASLVNDVAWLQRLDDLGRPKKIMKCGTLAALVREANKDMRKQASKAAGTKLVAGDEVIEYECADGWTVVRLLTTAALDLESGLMGHCIGNGAYDEGLANPDTRFLSLRDRRGKPHATMEIVGDKLIQLQGKQNKRPLYRYVSLLIPYFNVKRIRCTDAGARLVTDIERRTWSLDDLPVSLHIESDDNAEFLTLSSGQSPIRLPRYLA
ncbi:hypothetical protein HFN89_01480 [Rhizobium laguerreae]|nr:hypothetical protein [Rhizobium laguerreae]